MSAQQRVRRYYQSRGFATAAIGKPEVQAENVKAGLHLPGLSGIRPIITVQIPIVEGPRFELTSVRMEGDAKAAAGKVSELLRAIRIPSVYDLSLLEDTRQKIVDALGHYGYALARVDLDQTFDGERRSVQVLFKLTPGDFVVIGRIEFQGNMRLPDKFLRRELRVGEGEVFDSAKLDTSVERLNKSKLVQEVRRSDVSLRMDQDCNVLEVTFKVKEKDRRGIYGTGGTGGIGGGYLGLICTAFNLLRLGETLSFELDGGAAQSNILLDMVATHFLGSPYPASTALRTSTSRTLFLARKTSFEF